MGHARDEAPKKPPSSLRVLCSCGWSTRVTQQWMAQSSAKLHQKLGPQKNASRGEHRDGQISASSAEVEECHRIIRASVRKCGRGHTVETLETILARPTVPILRQLEEEQHELAVALPEPGPHDARGVHRRDGGAAGVEGAGR